jgi:hypothetical protein
VTGSAPVDVRFDQNSGTGNWQADQATKAFELSGGYGGNTNFLKGANDAGHNIFTPQQGYQQINPEGGFMARGTQSSGG